MRTRLAPSFAALMLAGSACATAHGTGGPDAPVQLVVPDVLAWEPGGPFELPLTLVNGTSMPFWIAEPKVEASDVTVYALGGDVVCRTPAAVQRVYEKWAATTLRPGRPRKLSRDLRDDCPALRPGVYRYEAHYRFNGVESMPNSLYRAMLGPQGGRILVREGATGMDEAAMTAALRATPPAGPSAGPSAPAADPVTAAAPAPAAAPERALSPTEIRACVDRELRDRGLNAYGDSQGTTYADGVPVQESGRILYVSGRNEAIRRACQVPAF